MTEKTVYHGRRRLGEAALRVWREIAKHPKGIGPTALRDAIKPALAELPIQNAIAGLRGGGYIKNYGVGLYSLWRITRRVPMTEEAPVWLVESLKAGADQDLDDVRTPVASTMPAKPMSAFHMANAWPFGERSVAPSNPTPPPPAPAAPSPARSGAAQPVFALYSDGVLSIDPRGGGDPVHLQPEVTRALFGWLDRLGGTQLQQIVERAS